MRFGMEAVGIRGYASHRIRRPSDGIPGPQGLRRQSC